ncbi:MAG TPA: PQQ-dependent sugar dehydrogenase [Acidimicrobiales bacterium]|jgi:glucose/arabinose dehydrogenase|nr:PQQ-dependent sugar dehydrogenase [Acidimicrobiales bacterium]
MRRPLALLVLAAFATSLVTVVAAPPASAATVPPGFTESTIGGLTLPTAMAFTPDNRIFVAEQGGALRVLRNGGLVSQPFVSLNVDSAGERGLLGVTVAPGFPSVNRVYVYYTVPGSGGASPHNRVSWFAANGDVSSGPEHVIIDLPNLGPTNHNGGALHFGNDGNLFIGVGENGTGSNAQNLATPLGKLLRVTPDGAPAPGNPFADGPGGNDDRVWAYGLRNPFTFAVRPSDGQIFIDDVGENTWEEIDVGVAGANYGWPQTEGPTTQPGINGPLYAYKHDQGCAITGGTFFESQGLGPAYANRYLFSDLCGGWIRALNIADGSVIQLASGIDSPVDLAAGPDGALWYLAHGSGVVGRIAVDNTSPRTFFIRNSPSSGTADATFTFGEQGDVPLFCDWDGNGTDTVGLFRNGTWFLRNTNSTGPAEATFTFGDPGDMPVCGDWNGGGKDSVGVYRNGVFYLKNTNHTGVADRVIGFGDPGDRPVVGDWDGNGTDTVGVFRSGVFFLRNRNTTGPADLTFGYGNAGDTPVAGDWNGDGKTTIGVWRPGVFLLRNTNSTGTAQIVAGYGDAGDVPATGNFDGAGGTGIAVAR